MNWNILSILFNVYIFCRNDDMSRYCIVVCQFCEVLAGLVSWKCGVIC